MTRRAPGHILVLLLAGCGSAPDGDEPDADDPPPMVDPLPPEKTIDDTSLFLGAVGAVFPEPGDTANALAGQQNAGFGIDAMAPDGTLHRKLFVTFSQHDDVPQAIQNDAVVVSTDGGQSFGGYRPGVMSSPAFAVELRDGRLLSYGFVPTARVDVGAESRLTLRAQESRDQGETWQDVEASMIVPTMAPGVGRLSGRPRQLGDGTIIMPWYGRFAGDAGGYRSELLASSNGGRTFVRRGSIAVPPAGRSYPEADVIELPNGSFYGLVRHHASGEASGDTLAPLLEMTSTDGGATWSPPAEARFPIDGGGPAPRTGIAPQLELLPNGVLVVSSGRRDNFVAISTEPDRVEWRAARVTYVNYPRATTAAYSADVLRVHGSSGNTGLEVLDANRILQFGDNCANGWGCPPADSNYVIDGRNRVWRRFVEVNGPDLGKIDLLSLYRSGRVRVTTDLDWTSPAHPRARVEGAFDGSNAYWSSAVGDKDDGEFTVELDRIHHLTRIGLSIRKDLEGSARVYTSLDGERWEEVAATDRTHRAIEYLPLSPAVAAAQVKVVVETGAACDGAIGDACAFLNELELYSAIDSFENDPVGGPPRGYQVTSAWVTGFQAGETSRALRLHDQSETGAARATWVGLPAEGKTLELSLQPIALASGFLFVIRGIDAAGAPLNAYHLGVLSDGRVARYDAARAMWEPLSEPGLVPLGVASRLRVEATLAQARVLVDGVEIATVPPSAVGAVALDGHTFSSGGTQPTGDHVLVDDVYFR